MASESGTESRCFKMIVPYVNVDGIASICLFTPQFARGEAHGIYMLRLLAETMSVGVWKNKHAVIMLDDAEFPPGVARQSRMARGVHIACADALSRLKACNSGDVSSRR